MTNPISESTHPALLRAQAVSRLTGHGPAVSYEGATKAFGVLHELASSPSTAADALALLHELQVHQVELDVQAEELRASREELESTLQRHVQRYDALPVGCFTIDQAGTLHELNLTGAEMLGAEREALLGQTLVGRFTRESERLLRAMVSSASAGQQVKTSSLQLIRPRADPLVVHASVNTDPAGERLLVVLTPG